MNNGVWTNRSIESKDREEPIGKNLRKKKKYLTTYISTDIIRLLGTIVTSFTPQHEHFVTEFLYHRQFLVLSSFSTFANPTPNKTQISCNFDFDRNGKCSSSRLHLPLSPKKLLSLSQIISQIKNSPSSISSFCRGEVERAREKGDIEKDTWEISKSLTTNPDFWKLPKKKNLLFFIFSKKEGFKNTKS